MPDFFVQHFFKQQGWSFNFVANKKSIIKYQDNNASYSSNQASLIKLAKDLSQNHREKRGLHQPQVSP
jgi:hypothetical protein